MSQNNNRMAGGLVLPQQVQVRQDFMEGPLATTVGVVQASPGQMQILQVGGAFRDEQLAAAIIGGILAGPPQDLTQDTMIRQAFALADEIMAFGRARRQPKPENKSGE